MNDSIDNKPYFSSIKADNKESRLALFNALESCDKLISECKGEKITVKDVYIEKYMKDGKEKFRTIIFDKDGKTFVTTSYGIVNALNKIFALCGEPQTWAEPITVEIAERPLGNGKAALTLKVAA